MTPLHALFIRRVNEEMRARKLNPNRLKEYGVKTRTLADVLNGADPKLSTIYAVAKAMGIMSPADLLREGADRRANVVIPLHQPQPRMIPAPHAEQRDKQDRKKRSR